jgi:hypothetical protein
VVGEVVEVMQFKLVELVVQVLLYFVWQTLDYSGTTTGSPTVTTGVGGTDTVLVFTGTGTYTT